MAEDQKPRELGETVDDFFRLEAQRIEAQAEPARTEQRAKRRQRDGKSCPHCRFSILSEEAWRNAVQPPAPTRFKPVWPPTLFLCPNCGNRLKAELDWSAYWPYFLLWFFSPFVLIIGLNLFSPDWFEGRRSRVGLVLMLVGFLQLLAGKHTMLRKVDAQ